MAGYVCRLETSWLFQQPKQLCEGDQNTWIFEVAEGAKVCPLSIADYQDM